MSLCEGCKRGYSDEVSKLCIFTQSPKQHLCHMHPEETFITCNMLFFQDLKRLERGKKDHNTTAHVSIVVYYTSAFKTYIADPNRDTKYTRNLWRDPVQHIKRQVAYANLVFLENKLPVKMELHLIEELKGFDENSDGIKRWNEFVSAKKSKEALLMSADVAILMTGSTPASGERGMAVCCSHYPFAWVFPEDELTFIHELGHIFGCSHNTEAWSSPGIRDKSNCGALVKG